MSSPSCFEDMQINILDQNQKYTNLPYVSPYATPRAVEATQRCDESPPPAAAIQVLYDCIELQKRKGEDYQNQVSTVTQADYFRRGIDTLVDMLNIKLLRTISVVDQAREGKTPNHESLEDSLKDLINYASFAVAYSQGKLPGQNPNNDLFNQPRGTV